VPAPSPYDYAVIRIVPRVERGEFINAGVILHCAERRYLRALIELDADRLRALDPEIDHDMVRAALHIIPRVCAGEAGPIGALAPAKRFDWLVSPRSTIVQTSPVHTGLCADPDAALEHLLHALVRTPREHGTVQSLTQSRTRRYSMNCLRLVLSILIPPLGVFLTVGIGLHFWLSIVLTILGYIPGLIHAVWIIATRSQRRR
jgi:uncharacterized membrane protein YqaE (UPF0057 family)